MNKQKRASIAIKISTIILAMVAISSSIVGVSSYMLYRSNIINAYAEKALDIAQSVAAAMDAEKVQEALTTGTKNQEWDELKKIVDKVRMNTDIEYLYIMDKEYGAKARYFMEAQNPDDPDPIQFGDEDLIDAFADEMYEALNTGMPTMTGIYDSIGYGFMVSGFIPLLDANNNAVCVIGADINVTDILNDVNAFGVRIILSVIAFSLIFWLIGRWYIKRYVGKPIKALSEVSHKIANGDMDINIDIKSNDEIGQLADNFAVVTSTIKKLLFEMDKMSVNQAKGDNEAFIDSSEFTGAFKNVADEVNEMVKQNFDAFTDVLATLNAFGKGDFKMPLRQFPGKMARRNEAVEALRKNLMNVSSEVSMITQSAISGDLSKQIDSELFMGDWKKLVVELNYFLQAVIKPIQKASKEGSDVLGEMSKGNMNVKIMGDYQGEFSIIKDSLNSMTAEISSYIKEIQEILISIAENDLTRKIERDYLGQFGNIKDSINQITEQLGRMVGDISNASGQVSGGSLLLSSAGQQLALESSSQTRAVETLTDDIEKINQQTILNVKNASNAKNISIISKENATKGTVEMGNMLHSMKAINESSHNISKVIKVIEDIAFQTNLLALNASVEAARAGQHGKGFSVVAEEVRNLAVRSQVAVKDTTNLICVSVDSVNEGLMLAESTADALAKIVSNVTEVSELIESITEASDRQAKAIGSISDGLKSISKSVKNNNATTQETSALAEELSAQSELLDELIHEFKIN